MRLALMRSWKAIEPMSNSSFERRLKIGAIMAVDKMVSDQPALRLRDGTVRRAESGQ